MSYKKQRFVQIINIWHIIIKVRLDRTYFAETENWKYCSKIIFKYVNSAMRSIFNEKVAEKWNLWVPWTVHGCTVHGRLGQQLRLEKKKKEEKVEMQKEGNLDA